MKEVYFGSIVFEIIRVILGLLIVFYEKILSIEKATKRKTKDFHPLRSFCASKKLLPLLFNVRLFLFCQLVMV